MSVLQQQLAAVHKGSAQISKIYKGSTLIYESAPPAVPSFTDDFNRADGGSLGSDWTVVEGGWSIVSNQANASGSAANIARHNTPLDSADHYAEITVAGTTTVSNTWGVSCRRNTSNGAGYRLSHRLSASAGNGVFLLPGLSRIIDLSANTISMGDVLRLEVKGTTIKAFVNGVQVGAITDGTVTSGNYVALDTSHGGANRVKVDNFAAGNL